MPTTPVISNSPSPLTTQSSLAAMSFSFTGPTFRIRVLVYALAVDERTPLSPQVSFTYQRVNDSQSSVRIRPGLAGCVPAGRRNASRRIYHGVPDSESLA